MNNMMKPELWKEYYKSGAGQAVAELAMTKIGCAYDQPEPPNGRGHI